MMATAAGAVASAPSAEGFETERDLTGGRGTTPVTAGAVSGHQEISPYGFRDASSQWPAPRLIACARSPRETAEGGDTTPLLERRLSRDAQSAQVGARI